MDKEIFKSIFMKQFKGRDGDALPLMFWRSPILRWDMGLYDDTCMFSIDEFELDVEIKKRIFGDNDFYFDVLFKESLLDGCTSYGFLPHIVRDSPPCVVETVEFVGETIHFKTIEVVMSMENYILKPNRRPIGPTLIYDMGTGTFVPTQLDSYSAISVWKKMRSDSTVRYVDMGMMKPEKEKLDAFIVASRADNAQRMFVLSAFNKLVIKDEKTSTMSGVVKALSSKVRPF